MAPTPAPTSTPSRWPHQPPTWPHLTHPGPAPILAILLIALLTTLLIRLLTQLLRHRLARRHAFVLVTGANNRSSSAPTLYDSETVVIRRPRPTSMAELEARQLLFPDECEERLPLRSNRGSLYDTFQIPHPPQRLKVSRSLMELNGAAPLCEGENAKKSKTVHLHGVNRLNTAWGWMS